MVVVGLGWDVKHIYQVVDGLSTKGADQMNCELDGKYQQD